MSPETGTRWQRFVGDTVCFRLEGANGEPPPKGWRALLRTNLGRADALRREIIEAHTLGLPLGGQSWRDIPMLADGKGWSLEIPLAEPGYFRAKAYALDGRGWQHWPEGRDIGISVHPDCYRTGNTIYAAFPRMFGPSKAARKTAGSAMEPGLGREDREGFTIIPPSGKLRDLARELPHVFQTLGCRILQLLPVNPTPTTYARFGRFGSPYAALDLRAVDPALVVFDRRTTGVDQFCELTFEAHRLGGRVFLDIVINHTGWGSVLQETHPEWFLRKPDGTFVSPGAWGTTWEDLVELKHENVALWDELADTFLTWCRRGVDGFRCDAGYMVPVPAWQYIVARVQQEYPETIFLLEGLGGAWEATEALLTEGGMQWAYSELFQNYTAPHVADYLDHSCRESQRVGLLVHYSETHDNERLATKGQTWSLLRNRLCALASISGGFGFTCGVEWLATEKIRVHGSSSMIWGNPENIVPQLAALNALLAEHPCFFDGAQVKRLTPPQSTVQAWERKSADGAHALLVLANTDETRSSKAKLPIEAVQTAAWVDLLGAGNVVATVDTEGTSWVLPAGAVYCLGAAKEAQIAQGRAYREARARAGWALRAMHEAMPAENIGTFNWLELAERVDKDPAGFLAEVQHSTKDRQSKRSDQSPPAVHAGVATVSWSLLDTRRITPVPANCWLLIEDAVPFRATLSSPAFPIRHVASIATKIGHIACFPPRGEASDAELLVERFENEKDATDAKTAATGKADSHGHTGSRHARGLIRYLGIEPEAHVGNGLETSYGAGTGRPLPRPTDLVLLTNGRGGMARISVDLGRVTSKYDCVLGANLHRELPVDRHILAKRIRVWVNADGFITPLDHRGLSKLDVAPPHRATWHFVANAGDGRTVEIDLRSHMVDGENTVVFEFSRPTAAQATGKQLPQGADVRLTVRLDIEDRNFHWETHRNGGADHHFSAHTRQLETTKGAVGFDFRPAVDRALRVYADSGQYHSQPEWSEGIPHPVEESRGQVPGGDAWSPGWFDLPLPKGGTVALVVTADPENQPSSATQSAAQSTPRGLAISNTEQPSSRFSTRLQLSIRSFVVRRGVGKTIIAGYPWFLDWGRDTFICCRGLLAAGMLEEVHQILETFGRFEERGTLPNTIFGEDASNRDTADAPLWFGLVCEEYGQTIGVNNSNELGSNPQLGVVLDSIASNYVAGTPNGIRVDPATGLVWSPSHFTWMDTNYPAGTPREGYPVEIQALWVRLLEFLAREGTAANRDRWLLMARQARSSLEHYFWLEEKGYYADVLLAARGEGASKAVPDDALRSNCLFVVSLGLSKGDRARKCVEAARRSLVIPGALRSLAPLPVKTPLSIRGPHGNLLNDPIAPYWGRYEGDEDTRRKPAYHNGTAWTWTFPTFCEALARAWEFSPEAVTMARAYLGSIAKLLDVGCLGHLPEILDGDAPHQQRGCDAQAWAATEALRVWRLLGGR